MRVSAALECAVDYTWLVLVVAFRPDLNTVWSVLSFRVASFASVRVTATGIDVLAMKLKYLSTIFRSRLDCSVVLIGCLEMRV